jgi:hypothetical protein
MLPIRLVNFLNRIGLLRRPSYLLKDLADSPDEANLPEDFVFREVRDGYSKWAYLRCPKCGEEIQLPLGPDSWSITADYLRRPTIRPSIWQTGSCGAHFFVTRGKVTWCSERAFTVV